MINLNYFRFGNALILGVALNLGIALASAEELFKTDFEDSEGYRIGPLNGQFNWVSHGFVKIDNVYPYSRSQFIWSSPGLANDFSLALTPIAPTSKLYVDFYLSPGVAESFNDLPQELTTLSAAVSSLVNIGNGLGELVIVKSDGESSGVWQTTGFYIVIEDEYNFVPRYIWYVYEFDYTDFKYNLFIDGVLAASDVDFLGPNLNQFAQFKISSDGNSDVYFDNFTISYDVPDGLDHDGDGLLTSIEDRNGNERADPDETDFMSSDTDGDRMGDGIEQLHRFDPLIPGSFTTLTDDGDGINDWQASFEIAEGITVGGLNNQGDWQTSDSIQVVSSDASNGTQSIQFRTDSTALSLFEQYFGTNDTDQIWISFYGKFVPGALQNPVEFDPNVASVFKLNSEGNLAALDRLNNEWKIDNVIFEPDYFKDGQWKHYVVHLDYLRRQWSLIVGGRMVFKDIPFTEKTPGEFSYVNIIQKVGTGSSESTFIDNITISDSEPDGLDFDFDGLENSIERTIGTDLFSADTDGDRIEDLWEYQNNLNPLSDKDGQLDSDGDGMINLDEFRYDFDPNNADVENANGLIRRDVWTNMIDDSTATLKDSPLYPQKPSIRSWSNDLDISEFESIGNFYGQRLHGLIIAPETAEYTFWIAGDDYCEFWLSTDANISNRSRMCYLNGYTTYQNWDYNSSQKSEPVSLEAGQAYYFEVLHKEHAGDDYVSVAWEYNEQTRSVITGNYLRIHMPNTTNDADLDGLPDDWETANGLDPRKGYGSDGYAGDANHNGRLNYEERIFETDPTEPNNDGDALSNVIEYKILGSDPFVAEEHAQKTLSESSTFEFVSIDGYSGAEAIAYKDPENDFHLYFGGGGIGLRNYNDGGQFVHKTVNGDFSIVMQLIRGSDDNDLSLSLIARESLETNATYVGIDSLRDRRSYHFKRRSEKEGVLNEINLIRDFLSDQRWLRMERIKDTFLAYASSDGSNWVFVGSHSAHLPDELYVGAFLGSGSKDTFRGVEIEFTEWNTDQDRDGLWDDIEIFIGTRIGKSDTDGDGLSDYEEYIHLGTDPLVADAVMVSPPLFQADGDSFTSSTGNWRVGANGSVTSLDYRGALTYDVTIDEAGFYRLDVTIQEGEEYRDVSQFKLLLYVDGVYAGEVSTNVESSQPTKASFWLPWLEAGSANIKIDWIPLEDNSTLQLNSISLVELEFGDQTTKESWVKAKVEKEIAIPVSGSISSLISPYSLYGQAIILNSISIVRDSDEVEFNALRALSDTFHANLPLSIQSESVAFTITSHNGLFSESISVDWQITNLFDAATLESPMIRPSDSLLIGWRDTSGNKPEFGLFLEIFKAENEAELFQTIDGNDYIDALSGSPDIAVVEALLEEGTPYPWNFISSNRVSYQKGAVPFTNPNREIQDSGTAPQGEPLLVDAYGLKKDEVSAISFEVPGNYFIRSTWREASGAVFQSVFEITVADVELGEPIAAIVGFGREWQPDSLKEGIELIADSHVILSEDLSSPSHKFDLKIVSESDGRMIARMPGTGAVVESVDVKAIADYSRLFGGTQKVIDVFPDGTKIIEYLFVLGGDLPEDFRIHLTPLSAGVLFEDGSLEQWITPEDMDELGRYRMRLTSPADVPTSGCFNFQYFQFSKTISDKI